MDKIIIRSLRLDTVVGVNPEERLKRRQVLATIELEVDLSKAAQSDSLEDTVDYERIKEKIVAVASKAKMKLIEALADKIAKVCLEDQRVLAVNVVLDKPGALRQSESVGVQMRRSKSKST